MSNDRPDVVLRNVMLGSNPHADGSDGGWPWLADRSWDVRRERREGRSEWSLACHHGGPERVGAGTVGWIHRWNGHGPGELAGVIVFDGRPTREHEVRGTVYYAGGWLRVLRHPVSAERIRASGWSGGAPYGGGRANQFASGIRMSDTDADVLLDLLDEEDDRPRVLAAMGHGQPIGDPGPLRRGASRRGMRRPSRHRSYSAAFTT